jgi:hypothetical protein
MSHFEMFSLGDDVMIEYFKRHTVVVVVVVVILSAVSVFGVRLVAVAIQVVVVLVETVGSPEDSSIEGEWTHDNYSVDSMAEHIVGGVGD